MAIKGRKITSLGHQLANLLAEQPKLAIATAIEQCLTPPRQKPTTAQSKLLHQAVSSSISVNGIEIRTYMFSPLKTAKATAAATNTNTNDRIESSPKDPPGTIILGHGFGLSGISLLGFIPAILEAGFRAVIFDHNSHGESSPNNNSNKRSKFDFRIALDTMAALLKAKENQPLAGIIAFSVGATIALATLARQPDIFQATIPQSTSSLSRQTQTMSSFKIPIVCMAPPLQRSTVLDPFLARQGLPESMRRSICDGAREVAASNHWMMPEDLKTLIENGKESLRDEVDVLLLYDRADRTVSLDEVNWTADVVGVKHLVITDDGLGHYGGLKDENVIRTAVGFILGSGSELSRTAISNTLKHDEKNRSKI